MRYLYDSHTYRSFTPYSPSLASFWSVRLHLRTISSNKPHPLARESILSLNIPPDVVLENLPFSATLQLAYGMLCLSITTGSSFRGLRAMVWNWKTGQLVFVSLTFFSFSLPSLKLAQDSWDVPTLMNDSQGFTMLNSETFMLTSIRLSGSLKIYAISHCRRTPATLLATLLLPEIQPEFYLRTLDSHSGPVHAHPPEHSLFTSTSESRIQVISAFYIGPFPGTFRNYSIFIHNDQILSIAKSTSPGSDLSWDSWGPQHTRFLPHCVPTNWLR